MYSIHILSQEVRRVDQRGDTHNNEWILFSDKT